MMQRNAQLIGGPNNNNNNNAASSSSWFVGAPISRLYAIATVVFYVLFHSKSAHESMMMDSFRMLRASQYGNSSSEWHRYWSSKLTFGSTGELVMGGMLLTYLSRQFEREMGSRKFGVFLLVTTISAMMMEMAFVVGVSTLMEKSQGYRYQGPYAVLGALMYLFHRYTPRLHPRFFAILGFTFSEKSFYYFWFSQVVGYGGTSTILATALGVATGYIYILTNLHQTVDIPDAIAKPLASLGAHLSDPPPRMVAPSGRRAAAGAGGAGADALQRLMRNNLPPAQPPQRPAAAAPPAPPDPAAIEQLTSMGFDRQRVMDALQATNNNVERAADRLLSG
ncbi:Rhomboid-like protein [Seminavis robusta]|uniref:Rhomboid-like protein n=1 Tax=Seminavis robusta TaxID=568900 RepID=A0A9N8H0Q9_9STRA|nr:Rhomboid-like protein [Seminavis robusta]|eukprot:Sro25_g016960.1 Rhomboid-like protein (336) ;mRNA; f:81213-82220